MKVRKAKAHCWHVSGVMTSDGMKFHASRVHTVKVYDLLCSACVLMLQCCRPGCRRKMLVPGVFVPGHNRFREGWNIPCTGEVHEVKRGVK